MNKVAVELMVPKEMHELVVAVTDLVKHFKEKKPLAEAMALLPQVLAAIEGVELISEEIKSDGKDEAAAFLVHKMWEALQ